MLWMTINKLTAFFCFVTYNVKIPNTFTVSVTRVHQLTSSPKLYTLSPSKAASDKWKPLSSCSPATHTTSRYMGQLIAWSTTWRKHLLKCWSTRTNSLLKRSKSAYKWLHKYFKAPLSASRLNAFKHKHSSVWRMFNIQCMVEIINSTYYPAQCISLP